MLHHEQQMHWMSSTTAGLCGSWKCPPCSWELGNPAAHRSDAEDLVKQARQEGKKQITILHQKGYGQQSHPVLAITCFYWYSRAEKLLFGVSYKSSEMLTHALYFTLKNGQKNIIGAFHCRKIVWVPSLCKTEWADVTIGVTNTIQWITSCSWFSGVFSASTGDNL